MPGVLAAFREGIWGDVVGGGEGLRCPCERNFPGYKPRNMVYEPLKNLSCQDFLSDEIHRGISRGNRLPLIHHPGTAPGSNEGPLWTVQPACIVPPLQTLIVERIGVGKLVCMLNNCIRMRD